MKPAGQVALSHSVSWTLPLLPCPAPAGAPQLNVLSPFLTPRLSELWSQESASLYQRQGVPRGWLATLRHLTWRDHLS